MTTPVKHTVGGYTWQVGTAVAHVAPMNPKLHAHTIEFETTLQVPPLLQQVVAHVTADPGEQRRWHLFSR
jgi:hypothetical protein